MERIRKTQKEQENMTAAVSKSLLTAMLVSGIALLILALLWYRLLFGEEVAAIGILVIYAASCLAAGLVAGKKADARRFFWGLLTGTLYFGMLILLTVLMGNEFKDFGTHFFTTWMICAGSGMLGGMLS